MKVVKNADATWDVLSAEGELMANFPTRAKANEFKKQELAALSDLETETGNDAEPSESESVGDPILAPDEEVAVTEGNEPPAGEPAKPSKGADKNPAPALAAIAKSGDVDRQGLFDLLKAVSVKVNSLGSPEGITGTQADIVELLLVQGPMSQNDIAKTIGCTGGNITMVADNLSKKGFAERTRLATDRRVVNVSLTYQGMVVAKEVVDTRQAAMDSLFKVAESEFGQKEVNQVARFLDALLRG